MSKYPNGTTFVLFKQEAGWYWDSDPARGDRSAQGTSRQGRHDDRTGKCVQGISVVHGSTLALNPKISFFEQTFASYAYRHTQGVMLTDRLR
eukprot:3147763-Pyramimonas_sp.AAC.1